jgi:hypothetical protein
MISGRERVPVVSLRWEWLVLVMAGADTTPRTTISVWYSAQIAVAGIPPMPSAATAGMRVPAAGSGCRGRPASPELNALLLGDVPTGDTGNWSPAPARPRTRDQEDKDQGSGPGRAGRTLVYDFGFLGFGLSWFASAVLSDISISERIASLRNARLTPTPTRPE